MMPGAVGGGYLGVLPVVVSVLSFHLACLVRTVCLQLCLISTVRQPVKYSMLLACEFKVEFSHRKDALLVSETTC